MSNAKTAWAIVISLALGASVPLAIMMGQVQAADKRANEGQERAEDAEVKAASLETRVDSLQHQVSAARSEAAQATRETKQQLSQLQAQESELQAELDAANATILALHSDLRRASRSGPTSFRCTDYDLDLATLESGECYAWEAVP